WRQRPPGVRLGLLGMSLDCSPLQWLNARSACSVEPCFCDLAMGVRLRDSHTQVNSKGGKELCLRLWLWAESCGFVHMSAHHKPGSAPKSCVRVEPGGGEWGCIVFKGGLCERRATATVGRGK